MRRSPTVEPPLYDGGGETIVNADPSSDQPATASRSAWRAFLWVALALAVVYLPIFLGQIIFFRDVAHWIFPARVFVRDSLLRGELPAWNPLQGLGFAALSNPLYGVFYPPNWLFLLVGPDWVASMITWQDFAHLLWGSAGVFWLARRLQASPMTASLAALVWALSGYTTAQWTSGLLLLADAWVPWAAVGQIALVDSVRAGHRRWMMGVVKAALPTAFAILLGEVFVAVIGVCFGLVLAIGVQVSERRARPEVSVSSRGWPAAVALALVLAAGVGAIVVQPARAAMASTARAAPLSKAEAEMCSLHPLRLIEFIAPGSMGDPYGTYPAAPWIGEPHLDGLPLSYSMYMGASVIALALAAFRRRRRFVVALGAIAGAALLIAMGRHLPVHGVFRILVFPLAYMRFPDKYTVILVAGLALLAGLGAARVLSSEAQPWRRTAILLALIVGFGIASPFIFPFPWSGFMVHGLRHGAVAVLAVLGIQVLAARSSRLAPGLLVVTVGFDLALACWPLQGFAPRALAVDQPRAARMVLAGRAGHTEPPRVFRSEAVTGTVIAWTRASTHAQGEARLQQTLVTSTANAWGIAMMPGYDAAIPSPLVSAWAAGEASRLAALQLFGVDYAVLPVRDPRVQTDQRTGVQPLSDLLPGARLYRVTDTLPRVFLAAHAEVLPDPIALSRLYEPAMVAGESVWLAPEANAGSLLAPPGRAGTCRMEFFSNRRLEAHCDAEQPGLAVFNEQYDRGWSAMVDSQSASVLRANLNMRALLLTPGAHHIVMKYSPPGFPAGAVVTLLSMLALLGLAFAHGRGQRRA